MTFSEHINRSVSNPIILVEMDIGSRNTQWVNNGSGIWKMNADAIYPEVEDELLNGFFAQAFTSIGSIVSDSAHLTKVNSLSDVSINEQTFYYDVTLKTLWIRLSGNSDPILHRIFLGYVYGFTENSFTPIGASFFYDGRLLNLPSFGYSRDPLYMGKISYQSININIINSDGEFDTIAEDNNIYGNSIRILLGFDDLNYSDYELLYSGFIENISIGEDLLTIQSSDLRKQLSKSIYYICEDKNALDAIKEIIQTVNPAANYNNYYFNTAEWDLAWSSGYKVTINMGEDEVRKAIDIIEDICSSQFGEFIIQQDLRYTFKIIDTSIETSDTIKRYEIINDSISISYDPSDVLSSARVSYAKIVDNTLSDYKTWLIEKSYENEVYDKYKLLNEKDFDTVLYDEANAQLFIDKIMLYVKDVHGRFKITVPMKYYYKDFCEVINVELNRINSPMIGTKKCEILGKKYNLSKFNITFDMRII